MRCLRNQEASMTLPTDRDPGATPRPSTGPGQSTDTRAAEAAGGDGLNKARGDELAHLSSMIKKFDDTENSEMTLPKLGTERTRNQSANVKQTGREPPHEIIAKQRRGWAGKPKLLGNVDAHNLESWKTIHPENWSNDEVMNWIYNIAEETDQIDVDILYGESFSGVTGKDLSRMSQCDFIKLDPQHGPLLHDLFSIINADFAPPDDCHISDTMPFIKELIFHGDSKDLSDVSLGPGPDSPEPPDSPESGAGDDMPVSEEHRLASLSIYGEDYPFDPDDAFRDWMEEKALCQEKSNDEKTSNNATYGESIPNLSCGGRTSSSSSGDTDEFSCISETTFSGSSCDYSASHYPPQQVAAHRESDPHQVPFDASGNFERLGQPQDESTTAYSYESYIQQLPQGQSMQEHLLHHQPHETVAFLKERGYHQDPNTGLFYTCTPDGSRMLRIPGLNETGNGSVNLSNVSQAHGIEQSRQGQYIPTRRPDQEQVVKKPRKTNTKPNNGPSKTNANQKQTRKSPKKSTKNDPDRPKGKRGRKKGQLSKDNHLWRFLLELLNDDECNPEHIRWENRSLGIFTIVNSAHVANKWGKKKKNPRMNYEKMSRAIRFCKTPGYIKDAPKDGTYPKKLCYAFGDNTTGWQEHSAVNTTTDKGN